MSAAEDQIHDDRFRVQVWRLESDRPPVGRALVLPGGGYTIDHPLLFWACQVAAGCGWQVATMRWTPDAAADADPVGFAEAGAELLDRECPPAAKSVVIAKSYGTRAAPWANRQGYPGIWLTPVLTERPVQDALTGEGPAALSVGGTADRLWDRTFVPMLRGTVVELEDANHALHVGSDWRASVAALTRTLAAIEGFLTAQPV